MANAGEPVHQDIIPGSCCRLAKMIKHVACGTIQQEITWRQSLPQPACRDDCSAKSCCDGEGRWVYADQDWARIASLAPTVLACAQDGDAVAQGIVSQAGDDLVRAAAAVVNRCRFTDRFPLILSGEAWLENLCRCHCLCVKEVKSIIALTQGGACGSWLEPTTCLFRHVYTQRQFHLCSYNGHGRYTLSMLSYGHERYLLWVTSACYAWCYDSKIR